MWIALVSVFGILKGFRELVKKKALEKSSAVEVLFFYTFVSFLFVLPEAKNAASMNMVFLAPVFLKSLVIFIAWLCAFNAITKLPIGLYGIMDMSRVIFASLLGIAVLGETLTLRKAAGLAVVLAGLLLVNMKRSGNELKSGSSSGKFIALTLISCFLSACSELLDKVLMQSLNSGQLQFWYMLFLTALYLGYMLIKRMKIDFRMIFKNYWIIILSLLFVIGDRALFIACADENSSVTAITLIKQCSVLVTIVGGRIIFHETGTKRKLLCAAVIIAGIMLALA